MSQTTNVSEMPQQKLMRLMKEYTGQKCQVVISILYLPILVL